MKLSNVKAKVFLVEDHPLTRKGLIGAIGTQDDLEVCGEAEGWREALAMIGSQRPDIVVLDLNLKDGSGWELIKLAETSGLNVPILVLSVCDEEVYAERVLCSGAKGYIMKDTPVSGVLEAIRKVLSGHIAVSNEVSSHLILSATRANGKTGATSELDTLSDRELQVFELLRRGFGTSEIADQIGINYKTVSTYKARLMEKMGVRTTPDLMALFKRMESPSAPNL